MRSCLAVLRVLATTRLTLATATVNVGIGVAAAVVTCTVGCGKAPSQQSASAPPKTTSSGLTLSGRAEYAMWSGEIIYDLQIILRNEGKAPFAYDLVRIDHLSSTRELLHREAAIPASGSSRTIETAEQEEFRYKIRGEEAKLIADLSDATLIRVSVFRPGKDVLDYVGFLPSVTGLDEIQGPARLTFIEVAKTPQSDN